MGRRLKRLFIIRIYLIIGIKRAKIFLYNIFNGGSKYSFLGNFKFKLSLLFNVKRVLLIVQMDIEQQFNWYKQVFIV